MDSQLNSKTKALLHLLEDESPLVRNAVAGELSSLDVDIVQFVKEQQLVLNDTQYAVLDTIFLDRHEREVTKHWIEWLHRREGLDKLEEALQILSRLQNGLRNVPAVSDLIQGLAAAFLETKEPPTPAALASFLFEHLHLTVIPEGSECSDGINIPLVLERKRGLPISLVCIYVLLGHHLGVVLSPCSWPGSYYARYQENDRMYLVDFSNKGCISTLDELLVLQGPSQEAARKVFTTDLSASRLIRRFVGKLALYLRREKNTRNYTCAVELLRALDEHLQS